MAGARTLEKAESAVNAIRKEVPTTTNTASPIAVDVTSDESINAAFEQVSQSPGRLDVLINNAGASFDLEYAKGRIGLRDRFNKTYDVNVTGADIMTHTFMPLLLKSPDPRLLFVAGLSSITEFDKGNYAPAQPQPAGWPKKIAFDPIAYRASKVALNMLTLDWALKLRDDLVKVWGVAPGMLATNLGGAGPELAASIGAGHPSAGGEFYLRVVEGERDADAGKVIKRDGLLAL